VIEPGILLCFPGAHLHASVVNTSRETRFSIGGSNRAPGRRRAAPNLDGVAPRVPLEWFRRIPDAAPLPAPTG
jgi:hypothetical protein